MKQFFVFAFLLAATLTGISQTRFIPANHQDIRYVGRFDFSKPQEVSFDWSGAYIQFSFRSNQCAVKMSDTGHNYYNVFIDDKPSKKFDVKSDTTLVLGNDLGTQIHKIKIYKRTEGSQGIATFKGILLDSDGEMVQWKEIPQHRIEFIGNSITCGYGTEGKTKDEHWTPETENNYYSYAPVIARAFDADYHIIAHSGQGVVRNYGDKNKISEINMPKRFDRVYDQQEEPTWNFRTWKPEVVVINLGTNDFSTQPFPDEADFKKGYENLINEVIKQYGEIPVFCLVGPMIDEPCYSYVKQMVDEFRNIYQKKNIYFVGIPTYLMNPEQDLGSDYHPNYSGQRKMAAHVIPVIASNLGWKYKTDELR